MEMESMVAVLKFTSCSGSSSEEEDDREICDDPTATLVIPSPSPTACEREETDSGICGECLRHVELPGWGWRGREGICGLSYSHVIARHTVAMTSCFFFGYLWGAPHNLVVYVLVVHNSVCLISNYVMQAHFVGVSRSDQWKARSRRVVKLYYMSTHE